jgi:hypothetical protein
MFYIYRVTYDLRTLKPIDFEVLAVRETRELAEKCRAYIWGNSEISDIAGFANMIDIYNAIENRAIQQLVMAF